MGEAIEVKRPLIEHARRIGGVLKKMLQNALHIPSPSQGMVDAFEGRDTYHSRATLGAILETARAAEDRYRMHTHPTFEEFVAFTQASLTRKYELFQRTRSVHQRSLILAKIARINATLSACYAKMSVDGVKNDPEWEEFMRDRLECGCEKDVGCICYARR